MSRTTYYRFLAKHNIQRLPGHRIHVGDIVSAFESERSAFLGVRSSIDACGLTLEEAANYAQQLLTFKMVMELLGCSRATFWRLRQPKTIPVLSGHLIHGADLVAELERRRGTPESVPGSNGKGRRPRKPSKRSVTQSASETDKAA